MATTIQALFKFVAKNPPMAFIVGGILCLLIGAVLLPFNPLGGWVLIEWAK